MTASFDGATIALGTGSGSGIGIKDGAISIYSRAVDDDRKVSIFVVSIFTRESSAVDLYVRASHSEPTEEYRCIRDESTEELSSEKLSIYS